jgi:hypothetical protein
MTSLQRTTLHDVATVPAKEWLQFIQNWSQIDVSPLLRDVEADEELQDAIHAILETGQNAWDAFDALRTFCVQRLYGLPKHEIYPSAADRQGRLTPYSLPYTLLLDTFKNALSRSTAETLDIDRLLFGSLHTFRWLFPLHVKDGRLASVYTQNTSSSTVHLVTSAWVQTFPEHDVLDATLVKLLQLGTNRITEFSLAAARKHPQPLFQLLSPNDGLQAGLEHHVQSSLKRDVLDYDILLFVEGWYYDL